MRGDRDAFLRGVANLRVALEAKFSQLDERKLAALRAHADDAHFMWRLSGLPSGQTIAPLA